MNAMNHFLKNISVEMRKTAAPNIMGELVLSFVGIIIGVALLGPLQSLVDSSNVTDANAVVIVGLFVFFFALLILFNIIRSLISAIPTR
jgi:hypothetical protein